MADGTGPMLTGHHLLVVEDDALVGMGLTSYLKELGAQVIWCSGVEDSLDAIARADRFHIAIVDLNLNGVMSYPVLDCLVGHQIVTILCTGYEASSIDPRYEKLPRSEKPFTRAKIRTMLLNHL